MLERASETLKSEGMDVQLIDKARHPILRVQKDTAHDTPFHVDISVNDYDAVNRGIRKFLRQFNWYDPDKSDFDYSWKNEIPSCLKKSSKMFLV